MLSLNSSCKLCNNKNEIPLLAWRVNSLKWACIYGRRGDAFDAAIKLWLKGRTLRSMRRRCSHRTLGTRRSPHTDPRCTTPGWIHCSASSSFGKMRTIGRAGSNSPTGRHRLHDTACGTSSQWSRNRSCCGCWHQTAGGMCAGTLGKTPLPIHPKR